MSRSNDYFLCHIFKENVNYVLHVYICSHKYFLVNMICLFTCLFISFVLFIESTQSPVIRECTEVCNATYWATDLPIYFAFIYILKNNEKIHVQMSLQGSKVYQEYFGKSCGWQ